ncbi:prominin [Arctopsyche grandis]|uniref:prominin n=1 Tax=Arctopsyche grandis TaxID=121162 RepID=UPI00406D74D0
MSCKKWHCTTLTQIIRGRTNFPVITLVVLLLFTHQIRPDVELRIDDPKGDIAFGENSTFEKFPVKWEPVFPERQLADVRVEAAGVRRPMKNYSSLQNEIKITNGSSIYNGDVARHESPSALVSEDCGEMKMDSDKLPVSYQDKDMEANEKSMHLDRKSQTHKSDVLLKILNGVSHMHRNDKGRRAVSEAKARLVEENSSDFHKKSHNKVYVDSVVNKAVDDAAQSEDNIRNVTASAKDEENPVAWRGRYRDSEIRFNAGPPAEKYVVPTMKIVDGPFAFRFLSRFFGCLHPFDFPTELLRDVMWNTLSVPQLILQSIRVEVGFIVAIIFAIVAALIVPVYGLCCGILALMNKKSINKLETSTPPPGILDDEDCSGACKRRLFMLLMQIFLIMSSLGIGIMVVGNEFANNTAGLTGKSLKAAGRDLAAYFQATHRELSHVLIDSTDQAFAATEHDLENIDTLLGEPIQKALAIETGLDVALDALNDITSASHEMSSKVQALGSEGSRAATLAANGSDRLKELKRQLDAAHTHCAPKDRPLCDTIDTSSLEIIINFEMISEKQLEPLVEALKAKNLSETTATGKDHFVSIPKAVANQTQKIIEDVREVLAEKRTEMRAAERSLAKVVRHLTAITTSGTRRAEEVVRAIDTVESAILMCLLALPMWGLTIVVFAFGGHGEVFLCRPLYDEPQYIVLGKLLDNPGLLYKENSGFFKEVFKELDNFNLNKPIRNVLNECKGNKPAYPVFDLRKVVDLNIETAHWNWSKLETAKEKFLSSSLILGVATPTSQSALMDIMKHTNQNFTDYRLQLTGPLTGKDLTSLADQLESVANQMSDLSTSSRIETLASRTRRLITNNVQPLEQIRTELVYRLTELELQTQPFQKRMNQSLSHLKTIQYYIDNQGGIIAQKKTQDYTKRLTGYLEQYRGHVLDQVERHVAPCGPIWDIYDATRSLICRHYIDSLNAFWLGLCSMLLLWMVMTPLALKLRHSFRAVKNHRTGILLRTISHQCPPPDNWR